MTEVSQNAPMNASTEKLSIVDKYFSLKKEQRINRIQFLVRLVISIAGILCSMGILSLFIILGMVNDITIFLIAIGLTGLIIGLFSFCIGVLLLVKRLQDMNGRYIKYGAIVICCGMILGAITGLIITYIIGHHSSEIYDYLVRGCIIVNYIGIQILAIFILIALTIPGSKGKNQYGPAPTGKPLV